MRKTPHPHKPTHEARRLAVAKVIALASLDTRFVRVNPVLCEILGDTASELTTPDGKGHHGTPTISMKEMSLLAAGLLAVKLHGLKLKSAISVKTDRLSTSWSVLRCFMAMMGTPEDVANVAEFFASDLSSHVSGQSLLVNGGALA